MDRYKLKGHSAVFMANVIFGLGVPVTKLLLDNWVTPMGYIATRSLGAAIIFWIVQCFAPKEKVMTKDLIVILLGGLLGFVVSQTLTSFSLYYTSPFYYSLVAAMTPVAVMLLAAVFIKERITPRSVIGVLLALFGGMLMIFASKANLNGGSNDSLSKDVKESYADRMMILRKNYISPENQEKIRNLIEADFKLLYQSGYPIYIIKSDPIGVNIVGHFDLTFSFINLSPKSVKAVSLNGYFVDEKGKTLINDIVPRNKNVSCRGIVTALSNKKGTQTWHDLSFYNIAVSQFVPTSIQIYYQDGSSTLLNGEKCQILIKKYNALTAEQRKFFEEHWQ